MFSFHFEDGILNPDAKGKDQLMFTEDIADLTYPYLPMLKMQLTL